MVYLVLLPESSLRISYGIQHIAFNSLKEAIHFKKDKCINAIIVNEIEDISAFYEKEV